MKIIEIIIGDDKTYTINCRGAIIPPDEIAKELLAIAYNISKNNFKSNIIKERTI